MKINKIYNEDCLEGMKGIADGSIDMILCDLPYGVVRCKWDTVIPFEPLWEQYKRVVKPNGAIVLTASQPFTSALGYSNIASLRYSWVWCKNRSTGHLNVNRMPMKDYEDILVFYDKQPTYNPQGIILYEKNTKRGGNGKCYAKSGRENFQKYTNYPRTHLYFDCDTTRLHPTQKPVALFEYLIKTYTNPGELVLDNCMGSGTTAIACMNTGRNFIGFEMDKGYYDIACKRIEEQEEAKDIK